MYDEMQDVIVRTRSYTIISSVELKEALKNMRNCRHGTLPIRINGCLNKRNSYDVSKIHPTRAGKYINLPKWKSLKKGCINIKNKDDTCFKYVNSVWFS